jgi:hypothetical protein
MAQRNTFLVSFATSLAQIKRLCDNTGSSRSQSGFNRLNLLISRRVHGLAKRPKRESLKVAMAMKSVEKAKKQSSAGHESIGKEIKKEISASNKV